MISLPGVPPTMLELVTFPVKVMLKIVLPVRVKAGVGENAKAV